VKEFFVANIEIFQYLSIPLISGLIGWGTNWLALKMTFYPVEFVGIGPIGWQGIVPSKAAKMSATAVDLWTSKLIKVQDIFSQLDPKKVAKEMKPRFLEMAKDILDEVMKNESPVVWSRVPESVKQGIYKRIAKDMPQVVERLMADMNENIEEIFDLKDMIVKDLTNDKALMNEVMIRCGKREFKFIEHSGFYFGFLFGLIQMAIWISYPEWWILPAAGLVVGYATNWVALKLIFEPVNEKNFLGMKFQGLFIKRQDEVSFEYSKMLAERILTPEKIFTELINGPKKYIFYDMVKKHVHQSIDETAGYSKHLVTVVAGERRYQKLKEIATHYVIDRLDESIEDAYEYSYDAMNLHEVLDDKMKKLTSEEFVEFLRPVFKEDELTLILVGAALGCVAGWVQLIAVFGW